MSNPFLRFSDVMPLERIAPLNIAVIGAGGIGVPACLCLAKMGVNSLHVWDMDIVGPENVGPQMYGNRVVGRPKTLALGQFLHGQADWCNVTVHNERFVQQDGAFNDFDVVVSAVDSLEVRQEIWQSIPSDSRQLVVDPRMGAEVLTVYSVIPEQDSEWYPHTLEGQAVEELCTAKATFHNGLVAGAMVAQAVKAWVMNERIYGETTLDLRFLQMFAATPDQKHQLALEKNKAEAAE
jgi:molybdopterin/thiamine biosynthesis adenylyltransferase